MPEHINVILNNKQNVKQRSVIKQCSVYKYTEGKTTHNQDQQKQN